MACSYLGVELKVINKYKDQVWNIEDDILQADLVVGLGRGIYEAMSCGRNVLIYDGRSYMTEQPVGDGFMTHINFPLFVKNNCSGRFLKRSFTTSKLASELNRYSPANGKNLRRIATHELNIVESVNQYLYLMHQ